MSEIFLPKIINIC